MTSLPKTHLLAALLLSVSCVAAHATSITIQGGFGYPNAKDSAGRPLAAGHKVSIGTFVEGFDPAAHASDLPALLANWREFHFTTTESIDGEPGSFWLKHTSPDGTNAEGFDFRDKKIHLLLTRTDAAYSEPAADGSNVRDYAVFTSDDPAWTFRQPASEGNPPPGDLSNLNTTQITTAFAGTADPASGLFALAFYSADPEPDPELDPENPGDPPTQASAFDQWVATTFGLNATISPDDQVGPSGLTALATFALDSSPDATAPPYELIRVDDRLGIQFTRKTTASGFETTAQACLDLSSWALEIEENIIATDLAAGTETVQAFPVFPAEADQSKAFFRIRVEPIAN
jgi:hypothetical protein